MAGTLMLINPRKRRKAAKRRTTKARKHNPIRRIVAKRAKPRRRAAAPMAASARRTIRAVRRRSSRRRSNPISIKGFGSLAVGMVKDAVIGGVGAVGVDAVMGQVKPMLPLSMQSGNTYIAVKALGTVALGMLARKVLGPIGATAAQGALTVQMASLVRSQVSQFAPGMTLGYLSPAAIMPGATSGKPISTALGRVGGLRAVQSNPGNRSFMSSGMLSGVAMHR